jgi:NADH-quinone oxidoreductase subunit E
MKSVETILEGHPDAGRDHLIPILQEVQAEEGYLSKASIMRVGLALDLPASKIFGVATFYNMFRFQPRGKFHVMVCRGTACHVKGSKRVLDMPGRPAATGSSAWRSWPAWGPAGWRRW